jgi:hypothetical protein
MKKIGDLMKEMGFNPKSSASVQEAFIKHLIKASEGVDVLTPTEKKIIHANPQKILNLKNENQFHQMSFDFEGDYKINTAIEKKTGS